MQINEQDALDQLAKQGIKIPPQPRVLLELQKLLASDDYDMRSVTKVISQDPGIVALLFKATRSPAFARARSAKTLDQIVMVVGIKQVFSLVQAVSLSSTICDSTRRAFEIFWSRAHAIAQMAAVIADDRVSVCNVFPEQAYLAGIFHECGVPVLMMRFPQYCETLKLENATCWPILSEEDTKFDVDHCSVGYLVARHWGLPDFVCDAIRYHHDLPEEKTIGASVSLVAIVQAASHFFHRLNHVEDPMWNELGPRVISELGLGQDEEDDFYEMMSGRFLDGTH
jgi:HD-like signal output (HDOD) protein